MDQVLTYLRENNQRFVQELVDYVKFPSVSAQSQHAKDMKAAAEWLKGKCQRAGLQVRVEKTAGHPVVVARTRRGKVAKKPHFVVYGHYDVQPPEPHDLWKPPGSAFAARIENGKLYGRGASDNKGQHLAHINAVEAYIQTGTELPCDLTFVVEGEEEVGSQNLLPFIVANKADLKCDAVVISDTGMPAKTAPALTYALRGIMAFEITVHGPNRDLHSGIFGGAVDNPAMALCQLLAKIRDDQGRITVPGFYDDVAELTGYEREESARLPIKDKDLRKLLGVPAFFGEAGYTAMEQRSARPTFEINGLTSGYQGEGSKTIIPAWARAKITMRLVPNQKPEKIQKLLAAHLKKLCPPTVRLEISPGHGGEPYLVSPKSEQAQAALRALKKAFKREPVLLREGGSIPIVIDFKRQLGADVLLLGLALPDDNAHSPNEKFDLECFAKGMEMSAHLWPELAQATHV